VLYKFSKKIEAQVGKVVRFITKQKGKGLDGLSTMPIVDRWPIYDGHRRKMAAHLSTISFLPIYDKAIYDRQGA